MVRDLDRSVLGPAKGRHGKRVPRSGEPLDNDFGVVAQRMPVPAHSSKGKGESRRSRREGEPSEGGVRGEVANVHAEADEKRSQSVRSFARSPSSWGAE